MNPALASMRAVSVGTAAPLLRALLCDPVCTLDSKCSTRISPCDVRGDRTLLWLEALERGGVGMAARADGWRVGTPAAPMVESRTMLEPREAGSLLMGVMHRGKDDAHNRPLHNAVARQRRHRRIEVIAALASPCLLACPPAQRHSLGTAAWTSRNIANTLDTDPSAGLASSGLACMPYWVVFSLRSFRRIVSASSFLFLQRFSSRAWL